MDIDKMSDDEIEAYLQRSDNRGSGNRAYGITLIVVALLGAFGSLQLILAENYLKANPGDALKCDINELFGCSTFLTSWQGHVLGLPNSYFGLAFFLGFLGLGVYLAAGRKLPELMWRMTLVGAALAVLCLVWFQYQSFSSRTLCPWCMLVWVAIIPLVVSTLAAYHKAAGLGPAGAFIARYQWLITIVWFVVLAAVMGVYFRPELARIF